MTRASQLCSATAIAVLAGMVQPASAQTQRSGAPASAQVMQQLQQLASERTTLQTENSKLKAELEKLKKERDSLKQSQDAMEQRGRTAQATASRSAADVQRLESDVARDRERMQELVARFRETAGTLREVETDRATALQSLAQRETDLKACIDRNRALYSLNGEVLAKLEDSSFWSSFARHEPFTQIKRNQLENIADDYRNRADDQKVDPASEPSPAIQPAPVP